MDVGCLSVAGLHVYGMKKKVFGARCAMIPLHWRSNSENQNGNEYYHGLMSENEIVSMYVMNWKTMLREASTSVH